MLLLALVPEKGREIGYSIDGRRLRNRLSDQVRYGREEVPECGNVAGSSSRGYVPGPSCDERYPDSALIEVSLDAPEAGRGVEELWLGAALGVRTVVRSEDNDGVVGNAEAVHEVGYFSDLPVEQCYHCPECRMCPGLGTVTALLVHRAVIAAFEIMLRKEVSLAGIYFIFRQSQLGVRNDGGIEHEERMAFLGIVPHEIESLLMVKIWGVLALVAALVAGKLDSFSIVPEMVGIVVVRETLAVVAVEIVHALLLRNAFSPGRTEAPFPVNSCGIAIFLEVAEDIVTVCRQRLLAFNREFLIAPDRGVSGVLARDEAGARRCADRCSGIMPGHQDALRCEPVDVGGLEMCLAHAAEISVSEVVCKYVNDVRPCCRLSGLLSGATCDCKERKSHG